MVLRFGFDFTLPKNADSFTYYGKGPLDNYADMSHCAPMGLYESDTKREYVPYVNPQEHGNHADTRYLKIGKLIFASQNGFEFNASQYSAMALFKARHTDELVPDGVTHLRIDYKVSGVGSAVTFAQNDRKLPIYCVETDKKQVAISFDAAWGNTKKVQNSANPHNY